MSVYAFSVPAIAAVLLFGSATTWCATYVVDVSSPRADDSNPGTAARPFRSLFHATDVVQPGDQVLIEPGVYHEQLSIERSGTAEKPIVFQAARRHGVILSGKNPDQVCLLRPVGIPQRRAWRSRYVTVRGIVFQDAVGPRDWAEMVTLGDGWRLEDCVVQRGGGDGCVVRGDNAVLLRDIFEDNGTNGAAGSGDPAILHGVTISDCIFRRNNQLPELPGGNCGACKFLFTDGLRAEGIISYDNYGSGFWLDWDNTHFTVTGCTIFGNHAGAFRYPRRDRPEFGQVRDESWAGVGLWSEANPGPGLIENNVIFGNLSSGIGILESGFKEPITIRGNLISDCPAAIELRAQHRGDHVLGRCIIQDNQLRHWGNEAITTSLNETVRDAATPADSSITIDRNTYDPGSSSVLIKWNEVKAETLEQARATLGSEAMGAIHAIPFSGPSLHVVPTKPQDLSNPAIMHQVPSSAAETLTIDGALIAAGAKANSVVSIPFFGRKALAPKDRGWTTEAYDLQARYVKLTAPDEAARKAVESIVPYTVLTPTTLKVKITRLEEYAVEATVFAAP